MKLKSYILIALVFIVWNINAQHIHNMRKFDIKVFNEHEKDINGAYCYELNDSIIVSLENWGDSYVERQTTKGTTIEKRYDYYKSGKIKLSASLFCNVLVDTTKWYNEYGDLVKEVNEDAPYTFSMEDIQKLIMRMFKIDILYPKSQLSIIRSKNEPILNTFPEIEYLYEIFIPTNYGVRKQGHELIIDATTGEILSHIDENGTELITEDKKKKKDTSERELDNRNWTPLLTDDELKVITERIKNKG